MKTKMILIFILLQVFISPAAPAHPGSGIVADKYGQIYFTDTGKGVWKLGTNGKLTFIPASRFHWMAIDIMGAFAASPKNFGNYFERVTPPGQKPTMLMCSDFPLVVGRDGNIYYADTRPNAARIIKRTPGNDETVLARDKAFQYISGMAVGGDGSLYITEGSNANANSIRKISMDGKVSVIATYAGKNGQDPPLETTAAYCRGLALDSLGNIFVAATGSRSVLKISPAGKITILLHTTGPWSPTGVTVFHGEVYVLEWHDVSLENLEVRTAYIPRVRKIGAGGKVTTLAVVSR